jgi:hypothetical protein
MNIARPAKHTAQRLTDCHAVAIEPGLRRQPPENRNIRGGGRRLSANSTLNPHIWGCRDRPPDCKSPPLVAISATIPPVFSELGNAWLATQCRSRPSPSDFPAIRELNRESQGFDTSGGRFGLRNCCAAGTFCQIPYQTNREIVLENRVFLMDNRDFWQLSSVHFADSRQLNRLAIAAAENRERRAVFPAR